MRVIGYIHSRRAILTVILACRDDEGYRGARGRVRRAGPARV